MYNPLQGNEINDRNSLAETCRDTVVYTPAGAFIGLVAGALNMGIGHAALWLFDSRETPDSFGTSLKVGVTGGAIMGISFGMLLGLLKKPMLAFADRHLNPTVGLCIAGMAPLAGVFAIPYVGNAVFNEPQAPATAMTFAGTLGTALTAFGVT
ncbi:MAG: hypothetical protein K0S29_1117 [Gammaproteobacteria bacterium]|nr:hypothetical protein [Gammaproteobacteria bacterium]